MRMYDAANAYMTEKHKRLRGNTIEGYVSAFRDHVLPAWGERELESITHEELQGWVDSIPTYGAAIKAFKTFRQAYRWSIRRYKLRIWDVTQGIELPERPIVRREVLDARQEAATVSGGYADVTADGVLSVNPKPGTNYFVLAYSV